jgi:hypothetical protein
MELSETKLADEIAEAIAIWIWDDWAVELVVNSDARLLMRFISLSVWQSRILRGSSPPVS